MSHPSIHPANFLVMIPAYNEEAGVADVISGSKVFLPVIVVDDGSTDRTAEIAEKAGAVVIRQVPNQGKGAAMRAGFRYALEHGYEAVITLDADRQHNPAEIPLFLERYQQTNADLIIGERDFSKMPIVRRCSNTIGRAMFSWALGQKDRDNQSGYRLLSRRLLEKIITSTERGFPGTLVPMYQLFSSWMRSWSFTVSMAWAFHSASASGVVSMVVAPVLRMCSTERNRKGRP